MQSSQGWQLHLSGEVLVFAQNYKYTSAKSTRKGNTKKGPSPGFLEHSKEQGTSITRDNKSAAVIRKNGKDEPRNDPNYDDSDEPEHGEYDDAD